MSAGATPDKSQPAINHPHKVTFRELQGQHKGFLLISKVQEHRGRLLANLDSKENCSAGSSQKKSFAMKSPLAQDSTPQTHSASTLQERSPDVQAGQAPGCIRNVSRKFSWPFSDFTQLKADVDGPQLFSTPTSTSHNHTSLGAQSRFRSMLFSPFDTSPVNSQT